MSGHTCTTLGARLKECGRIDSDADSIKMEAETVSLLDALGTGCELKEDSIDEFTTDDCQFAYLLGRLNYLDVKLPEVFKEEVSKLNPAIAYDKKRYDTEIAGVSDKAIQTVLDNKELGCTSDALDNPVGAVGKICKDAYDKAYTDLKNKIKPPEEGIDARLIKRYEDLSSLFILGADNLCYTDVGLSDDPSIGEIYTKNKASTVVFLPEGVTQYITLNDLCGARKLQGLEELRDELNDYVRGILNEIKNITPSTVQHKEQVKEQAVEKKVTPTQEKKVEKKPVEKEPAVDIKSKKEEGLPSLD